MITNLLKAVGVDNNSPTNKSTTKPPTSIDSSTAAINRSDDSSNVSGSVRSSRRRGGNRNDKRGNRRAGGNSGNNWGVPLQKSPSSSSSVISSSARTANAANYGGEVSPGGGLGEGLATTISGIGNWIGGFQEAYLDGGKSGGGGSGYYGNYGGKFGGKYGKGGRCYYTDGTALSRETSNVSSTSVVSQRGSRNNSNHGNGTVGGTVVPQTGLRNSKHSINSNDQLRGNAGGSGRGNNPKQPSTSPVIYHGRKIVSDINHLYEVVDDKDAYLNYDVVMSSHSSHHSGGGNNYLNGTYSSDDLSESGVSSANGGSSVNSMMMREEELVDRMLSQFPEFGTNRPTPFTIVDDDDETTDGNDKNQDSAQLRASPPDSADNHVLGYPPRGPVGSPGAPVSNVGGIRSSKGGVNSGADGSAAGGTGDETLSPGRLLSEDASDIIGRFFFGIPPLTSSAADGGSVAGSGVGSSSVRGGGAKRSLVQSSSFGSSSSLSTMTSGGPSGKGGKRGVGADAENSQRGDDGLMGSPSLNVDRISSNANGIEEFGVNDENDYAPGWDQDEIDLWCTKLPTNTEIDSGISFILGTMTTNEEILKDSQYQEAIGSSKVLSTDTSLGSIVSAERKNGSPGWSSRRKMLLERRKKRHNWDDIGENALSAPGEPSNDKRARDQLYVVSGESAPNGHRFDRVPSMEMSVVSDVSGTKRMGAMALGGVPDFRTHDMKTRQPKSSISSKEQKMSSSDDSQRGPGIKKPVGAGAVVVDDGKQHWMPDNLCKHCYSCEAPFTLLRRKHHCRLCGMIFCSACSAYFVEISSELSDGSPQKSKGGTCGTMRTCKMCYDHISERGLGVMMRGVEAVNDSVDLNTSRGTKSESSKIANDSVATKKKESGSTDPLLTSKSSSSSVREILLPIPSSKSNSDSNGDVPHIPTSSSELTEQFAGLQGSGGEKGDFHALSITKQRLDEERRKREEQERVDAAAAEAEAADREVSSGAESQTSRGPFRLKSRLGSLSKQTEGQMKEKGTSNCAKEDGLNTSEMIEADSDAVEVSVGGNTTIEQARPGLKSDHTPILHTDVSGKENNKAIGMESAVSGQSQNKDAALTAKVHLGTIAADYLEKLGRELLQTDAPLLLSEISEVSMGSISVETKLTDTWVNTLMELATRCAKTVEPEVKNGDLLDVRPYCKVKVISGGSVEDCAYMSGVVFHKNVSHKKMARAIPNAKIMLLSGGIEYTRTENRIASLDTLLEQEERYMEILVTKIFKLKPDVLLVGRSVSRKAQELLLRANICLIQYVKPSLMSRIARQTSATILSSTDHIMNQFGSTILGHCRRFRVVAFRDNDVWTDNREPVETTLEDNFNDTEASEDTKFKDLSSTQKCVSSLLLQTLSNHERQQVLAAKKLGENVLDGFDAVKCGLAKRGVVKSYVMIEGCPKELGCTMVLRGASRPALKLVKRILRFLVNAAYNLKLETCYILERCCRLPSSYTIPPTPCCSSSLCVDFGQPPNNRKVRPWNGGRNDPTQRSISGKITPLDHQAILITSVWMTDKTQCCPAEVKGICYYSMQDVSLGQFLRDSCFNLSLKCQNPSCKKSVIDHSLSFIHNDGLINITVERMDNPIPTSNLKKQISDGESLSASKSSSDKDLDGPIATWTYCKKCEIVVTPLVFLSKQVWQWSFGKFLEVYFYNRDAIINAPGHRCSCQMQSKSVLYFGCGTLAARFTYEKIAPYSVFCRRHLPFDESFHRSHSLQELEHISMTYSNLFAKFDKQIDAISRETRELFGSAMNKPEHLQAVLSELNLVSSEVEKALKMMKEKIVSVTAKFSKGDAGKKGDAKNEHLFNFPWYSRRFLFMLTSAWNERLSAAGQAVSAMKKIQYVGGSGRNDTSVVVGDASTEDVIEGIKRIRQLQENYSRNYNVRNMTMSRSQKGEGGLFEGNILPDGRMNIQEAEMDDEEFYSDPENDIDFEDDIDADVLASRNRAYSSPRASSSKRASSRSQRPKKTLGTRRHLDSSDDPNSSTSPSTILDQNPLAFGANYESSGQPELQGKAKTVSAGGAVKSALTRFFNRGLGGKEDPYAVDLGFFGQGRPRLQPGIGGLVIPVFDDQPSTIIAHSLASSDYDIQFKQFLSASGQSESKAEKYDSSRKDIERRMLGRNKSHIKHTFRDFDEKGQQLCKFVCTTFWSIQFNAVRQAFMNPQISSASKDTSGNDTASGSGSSSGINKVEIEKSYIRSLATSFAWAASGGKSGASFSRTSDDRFVIKCISRTELQMFLDCAPAYFEYLSKAFFHGLPTVLCKIVGVYQIGYHNRVSGKRSMEQVAVMQNIFFGRNISKIFDLKGSLRGRFTRQGGLEKEKNSNVSKRTKSSNAKSPKHRSKSSDYSSDSSSSSDEESDDSASNSTSSGERTSQKDTSTNDADKGEKSEKSTSIPTLLDGDFLEFTGGRPLPLTDRAKAVFHMSILNDTLFLSIINVLDYSILVGIDEEKMELVVGIIDFMRQYDILKQMERVGKSLPMVVGSEAPTIIQPPLYKARFTNAMERYFMTVPSKWTSI